MRGATLSGPLPVFGLVGRYPTNNLMGRGPLLQRNRRVSPLEPFPCRASNPGKVIGY